MVEHHSHTGQRPYRSSLRASQAAQTRARVLDAAAQLFARTGYAGTALGDIARGAGVSVETVKAMGPKRGLLLASFERSFAGADGLDSLADHHPVKEITAELDDEAYLARIVHFVAESNRRSCGIWTAFVAAAASDDLLAHELEGLQRRRRNDMLVFVAELRARGLLTDRVSDETCADAVSFLLSPEGYTQLVEGAGWAQEHYERWLTGAVRAAAMSG